MIQRTKWIVLASVTSFLLISSCGVPVHNVTCNPTLESQQPSQSDSIEIAIHVDGSGSMLGYVTNNTSRYIQSLKLLDDTFSLGGSRPKQTVTYYRSGTDSPQITRSDFRKAQLPEFYDGSNPKFPGVSSGIDAAITPPENGDKLFVMVTDLYQNNADVTLLNKKIKETYLNQERKGYAVGIVAIKSEFNGTVYHEVGNTLETFPYTTEGKKPEQFRPFYILFLGPYKDISYYFDKLKRDGGQLLEDSKFIIFSPENLVSKPFYISEAEQPLPQDLKQPDSLNNGKIAIEVENNENFQLLEIDRNSTEEFKINYNVVFNPVNYGLTLESNSIDVNFKIKAFDIWEKQFKDQSNNSPAKTALQLNEWKQTDNQLSFVTTLRPDSFPEAGIYLFTVDVVAKSLQEPAWWEDWTASSENDGSKTHNLSSFLKGLKIMTTELMEKNPPVIGHFCYAIQKN